MDVRINKISSITDQRKENSSSLNSENIQKKRKIFIFKKPTRMKKMLTFK